jgi:hypothetical protein
MLSPPALEWIHVRAREIQELAHGCSSGFTIPEADLRQCQHSVAPIRLPLLECYRL